MKKKELLQKIIYYSDMLVENLQSVHENDFSDEFIQCLEKNTSSVMEIEASAYQELNKIESFEYFKIMQSAPQSAETDKGT